jgi:glucose/arabinose dehydrogenase
MMRIRSAIRGALTAALLCLPSVLFAQIQLTPIVSGLSSPLFVGHAGDGTNRLFIVEQGGTIRVLQPGASTTTVFLNITSKVLAGGERGLLGLAFHPQYISNGRFFVFYTRAGDGALVIAEYKRSSNINVADTAEKILLVILHPTNANHNGGMLAFGPDGNLYIGVGDGGSSYDPPNNAQTKSSLLGKILRIDVNTTTGYRSPSSNPFVNEDGRDEIFALGMRNPWRFSFDRSTGQQWVADVGQGAREEVDTPIVNGGNYGWRVYEGNACTNTDPAKCIPSNYIFPVFEYTHSGSRCSITGGYVYRGSQGALPSGTYVYADFCTGEIFSWNGSAQTLLLDTTMNISSFGEDEAGEIYVVNLGGSVARITGTGTPQCTFGISPSSQNVAASGGTGNVTVTAGSNCGWIAVPNASWLHVTGGSGTSNGAFSFSADANAGSTGRSGTITIATKTFTVIQAGATTQCTYSISPTQATFPISGGTGTIAVTAGQGCAWTAVSSRTWITITGGASGSGNGTVSYSVGTHPSTQDGRGVITIAGLTFVVRQLE